MFDITDPFDIRLIVEPSVTPNEVPIWGAQPSPSFESGVASSYSLNVYDPEGGPVTITLAPGSSPLPSWLTISGLTLVANGTQQGAKINGVKLRATDQTGLSADSQTFTITSTGWITVPNVSFLEGTASAVDMRNYYIGFDASIEEMVLESGSLSGISFEYPFLKYDGLGVDGVASFQLKVQGIVVNAPVVSSVVIPFEYTNPSANNWGPSKYSFCRRLELPWRRGTYTSTRIGDWLDRNQVEQGTTPWATITSSKGTAAKLVNTDVTNLVKRWHANKRNKGFIFVYRSGTYSQWISRNNSNTALRPYLTVTVSTGKVYTIPCAYDAHFAKSSGNDLSLQSSVWMDAGQSIMSYYNISGITESTITSAILSMYLGTGGGSGSFTIDIYELDGREVNLFNGTQVAGISNAYLYDNGLENDPDVYDSFDFQEKYVNTQSPEWKFFQGGTGQAGSRVYYFDQELQCNAVKLGWNTDGFSGLCNLEFGLFDNTTLEPLFADVYARYVVKYHSPWDSVISRVKMPGFCYRWGWKSPESWVPMTGNSGDLPTGNRSPHFTRWAPMVDKIDATTNRIQLRNKVNMSNVSGSGAPDRFVPADGTPVTLVHQVAIWASVGLTEGNTYYWRNPQVEQNVKSSSSDLSSMSGQLSLTPTGPIISLSRSYSYAELMGNQPSVGFGDPNNWLIARYGGSMRSQVTTPNPDYSDAFGHILAYYGLMGWPDNKADFEDQHMWVNNDRMAAVTTDRWYSIEHHFKMNTINYSPRPDMFGNGIGNADGWYEVWIDGQLAFSRKNYRWGNTPSCGIQSFWFDIFHGGANASPVPTMYVSLARLAVATKYIGPIRKS